MQRARAVLTAAAAGPMDAAHNKAVGELAQHMGCTLGRAGEMLAAAGGDLKAALHTAVFEPSSAVEMPRKMLQDA